MPKRKRPLLPKTDAEQMVIQAKKPAKFMVEDSADLIIETKKPPLVWWVLGLLMVGFGVVIILVVWLWWYVTQFEQAAEVSATDITSEVKAGFVQDAFNSQGMYTILVLGIDEITNQREGSLLTDTILLTAIHDNGVVTLISLPRDLWIDSLKTKINALYYYGESAHPGEGEVLVAEVIEEITGIKPDYTMVLTMAMVAQVIDTMGGITLTVPETFVDTQFPRADVDIQTVTDPDVLYTTVTFESGEQHMDGERALTYMRSRHSTTLSQGTDIARNGRQQAVIGAMVAQVIQPGTLIHPEKTGGLLKDFLALDTSLSLREIISLGRGLWGKRISFQTTTIPVESVETPGIITIPPVEKYNQWVFEPVDPSWEAFQLWACDELYQ